MIYQSVSIENVISKVIRDTKIRDTSAIMELYEVIPECMGMLQTRFQFHHTYKDLRVSFHKAQLPSGLMSLPAVEYCGHRLPWRDSARAINAPHVQNEFIDRFIKPPLQPTRDDISDDPFITSIVTDINPSDGYTFVSYTIEQLNRLPYRRDAYYFVEMGYISTSFPEGWIRLHYHEAPKDEAGNLLVPDNSNYKEALYYYCRAKLIGMGVYEDKVIGEEKCMHRYELYGSRAIDEIDYPTEDQMRTVVANQVRLIPPAKYWEGFSAGTGRGTIYG